MIKNPAQEKYYRTHRAELLPKMRERARGSKPRRNAYLRRWRKRRPELERNRRVRYILKRYGLTPESYQALIQHQGGVCPLCCRQLLPMGSTPKGQAAVVDHKDTKVRGILCSSCNIGLGVFYDNAAVLKNAILYLERNDHAS